MKSRKSQQVNSNQCEGKHRFVTKEEAKRASASHHKVYHSHMRAYYCSLCEGYHIGHALKRAGVKLRG